MVARADVQVVPHVLQLVPQESTETRHLSSETATQAFPPLSFSVGEIENFRSP